MNNRIIFSLAFIILGFFILSFKIEEDTRLVLKQHYELYTSSSSWSYDIHYRQKFFSSEDTFNYYNQCRFIREESDEHFGGIIWIKNDSIEYYYDLENIYWIEHKEKKITRFFPDEGQDWAIKGTPVSSSIETYFFNPTGIINIISYEGVEHFTYDTMINQNTVNIIEIHFPDSDGSSDMVKTIYIDQEGNLKHMFFQVQFQNNWQYNEWNIRNSKYNTVTKVMLQAEFDSLALLYPIEDFEEPDPIDYNLLEDGTKAPLFNGLNYQTKDSISLSDYKGKYIILDFWYKSCYPCIKSIPIFNDLREKYTEDQLIILGLNPYDNKEKEFKKLDEFIEYNKMIYPTIFIDFEVVEKYKSRVFPTFYVINPEGKVIFSRLGFSENYNEEIKSFLETKLN